MEKRTFLTALLVCVAMLGAKAQSISGRVVDETDAPIPYATVVAMQLPDSTFLGGMTTDIFNTMLYWQQSTLRGNSLVFFDSDGQNIMLNVTYKFGQSKVRLNSRSVSEEERDRL